MPIEHQEDNKGINGTVESKEQPAATAIFVYRGQNPLLQEFAAKMESFGMKVANKILPIEKDPLLKQLENELGAEKGVFITDKTMFDIVKKATKKEPINAYDCLEQTIESIQDVVRKIKPIVEEIRNKGKIPVVLRMFLGDHVGYYNFDFTKFPKEEIDEIIQKESGDPDKKDLSRRQRYSRIDPNKYDDQATLYSRIISDSLDVPIIKHDQFYYDRENAYDFSLRGNVIETLEKLKIQPENAVLLVDHHIYLLSKSELKKSGLQNVEVVQICPCCNGLTKKYRGGSLESRGFKVFPLEYEEDRRLAAEELKRRIESKK